MDNSERLIRFDWAIKSILRDKANFDIMECFLSALLKTRIFIREVLESESNQDEEKQKFNRVDILGACRTYASRLDFRPFYPLLRCRNTHVAQLRSVFVALYREKIIRPCHNSERVMTNATSSVNHGTRKVNQAISKEIAIIKNRLEGLKSDRLLVRDGKNQCFIIEIQAETESDYLERLLFGTCRTVVDNLKVGEPYRNIKKVISISIMYFNLGRGDDYLYHGRTEFKGVHTGEILKVRQLSRITDENNRTVRVIEAKPDLYPEYYLIEVERFEDAIQEDIDEWVYFFKNEQIRDDFHSLNIQAAREKLNLLRMDIKERKAYEKYLMLLASERDPIETARAEGVEKGKLEVAKGLKASRVPHDIISKTTGLTAGEIEQL